MEAKFSAIVYKSVGYGFFLICLNKLQLFHASTIVYTYF